mmetsp:Transcript_61543/g.121116  ORF Transcript_61543/g.121116 Transcript_61543/m.121116 type:complete len:239 (+) Transcript_61543:2-718(+)
MTQKEHTLAMMEQRVRGLPGHHVVWGAEPASSDSTAAGNRQGKGPEGGSTDSNGSVQPRFITSTPRHVGTWPLELDGGSGDTVSSGMAISHTEPGHILFRESPSGDSSTAVPSATPCAPDEGGASTADEDPGPLPSEGSRNHGVDRCKPCMFVHTAAGCARGFACSFCHYTHGRSKFQRPCKAKRDKFKAIAERQVRQRAAGMGAKIGIAPVGDAEPIAEGERAGGRGQHKSSNIMQL